MDTDTTVVIAVTLYPEADYNKVQVHVTDLGAGIERDEEFTDPQIVMSVYTLMDMLVDVIEGRRITR